METIKLAVEQAIDNGSSLRGVEKTFKLYRPIQELAIPTYTSIRKGWLMDYHLELNTWEQMVNMTRTLESQLKQNGRIARIFNSFSATTKSYGSQLYP